MANLESRVRGLPQPLKWALLVAVVLLAAYVPFVLFYEAVEGVPAEELRAEAARLAEQGAGADVAFARAVEIAPRCAAGEMTDPCRLTGKIFLEAYLVRRPQAHGELCDHVEDAPVEDTAEPELQAWASARCTTLGHPRDAACREVHTWLADHCG